MTLETVMIVFALVGFGYASASAVVQFFRSGEGGERAPLISAGIAVLLVMTVLVMNGIQSGRVPAFGRFESLACYTTAVTVSFLVLAARHGLRGISAFVLPYVTALLLVAVTATGHNPPDPGFPNSWLTLHVLSAFAGYGLFTISAFLAVAYLVQDHNLKHKNIGAVFERLPSLGMLDRLMHRQMGIGFLMLTVSMLFGVRLVCLIGGGPEWLSDPKVATVAVTWFVYATLLYLRGKAGHHGRRIAIATLVGLLFVLFTFVGVGLFAESRHAFALPRIPGS